MLNRRIESSNLQLSDSHVKRHLISQSPVKNRQTQLGFNTMCVTIALLSGLVQMQTARAALVNVASNQQRPQLAIDSRSRHDNSIEIAQNTTAPATYTNLQLPNDLNLPKTGNEVQITGRQSITLQKAIEIAFNNNRQVQAARLTVERDRQGINVAQASQAVRVGLSNTGITTSGSPLTDRRSISNSWRFHEQYWD